LAKNKHLTRLILAKHDIPNIPFLRPHSVTDALHFLASHKRIIAKPVSGAGAHDIHIIEHPHQLEKLQVQQYILEQYIPGKELRYLVLQGDVIGVHESKYGTSVQADRYLERVSYPKSEWDPALEALSRRIAGIIGLQFAAVDYLVTASGRVYLLEVNATPGLKWFHAPSTGPVVDVATAFLKAMLAEQHTAAGGRRIGEL
jgi:glutathione synthase/RimK-type ligase-like ATP-grasp enzyme